MRTRWRYRNSAPGNADPVIVAKDRADPIARRPDRTRSFRRSHRSNSLSGWTRPVRVSPILMQSSAGWPICWSHRENKYEEGYDRMRRQTMPYSIDFLKQDVARTHDALEAMHGTLDRVADRLTTIEKNIRSSRADSGRPARPGLLELTQIADIAPTQTSKPDGRPLDPIPAPRRHGAPHLADLRRPDRRRSEIARPFDAVFAVGPGASRSAA